MLTTKTGLVVSVVLILIFLVSIFTYILFIYDPTPKVPKAFESIAVETTATDLNETLNKFSCKGWEVKTTTIGREKCIIVFQREKK